MSGHVEITITESDIKKTLLHYNYGSYISHENISFGYANENFKVTTTTGNILFRLYKQQTEDSVRQELLLMNALQNSDFPTAYPLVDNSGAYIHSIN
jgi:Ser/Thr protein kinase RdoA (MazF antagonist)